MDVTKLRAAIAKAHEELNTVIDGEFKERHFSALGRLNHAANALILVEKHVATAVERNAPKMKEPAKKT